MSALVSLTDCMNHKKTFPFLFFIFCTSAGLFSQSFPEQDCISAIPVCQDTYVQTTPYNGIGSPTAGPGVGGNEINGQISCMTTGEKNDVWYTFTVQTSGNLCFSIIPFDMTDDYDWAVFNLTTSPCDSIFYNSALEVSCNFSPTPGITGANDSTGSQNDPCISVNSGETYVLNVSQFTPSPNGYTLNFSTSTAQLFDNIPPEMTSVATPITCGETQLTVSFSENVICSTVQTTDFILSGPSGPVSISGVTSNGCTSGSTYDNQFVLTVSPAISPVGNFTLVLLANAAVEDLCNNPNVGSDTAFFSVFPFPLQISTTPQLCSANNGTATVDSAGGNSPYTYSWNSTPGQSTQTATGLIPGAYTVTVTDIAGCVSTGSGLVGFDPGTNPPVASVTSSTGATCSGLNNGAATVGVTGGTSPYVYIWSNGQTTPSATGLGTGVSICTVTDFNGCYDTAAVNITGGVPIIITPIPADTTICKGGTAVLSASVTGGANPFTFSWLKNGMPDGTNIPYPVNPTGTTTYGVFATDNAGCMSDTANITVYVLPPISVNISPVNLICIGDSVKLKANVSGGKGNGYTYVWSNTMATGNEIYVKPNSNTTFTVTVSDGCTSPSGIASIDVSVGQPPPTLHILANQINGCVPLTVQFHLEPFVPGFIYKWNFGDGNLLNTTLDTVFNTYIREGCKNVSLVFITNEGCTDSIIDSCMINPYPTPRADFKYSPSNPTTLSPIVNFLDQSSGAEAWQWDLGDNSISDKKLVQHEYADSGSYNVRLVVSNSFQCTDTALYVVYVDFETTLYIPNTFSPNDDGLNDVFGIVYEGIVPDGYLLRIFNRWGSMVFQSDNISNLWDGKINGNNMQDGVYIYYIKYKTFKGEEKKMRGSVTLLK